MVLTHLSVNNIVGKVKTAVTSRSSSNKSQKQTPGFVGVSNYSIMALQTIGGSSVPSKSVDKNKDIESGRVQIQRSWRVESNSRSTLLLPDEAEGDEDHILSGMVAAQVNRDLERQI